jgi:hypothetical protein
MGQFSVEKPALTGQFSVEINKSALAYCLSIHFNQ